MTLETWLGFIAASAAMLAIPGPTIFESCKGPWRPLARMAVNRSRGNVLMRAGIAAALKQQY